MSQDEAQIKKALDFILEETYSGFERYTEYFIRILPKERKTKDGDYRPKEFTISIFNLSRKYQSIMLTCLYELTKHIEYVETGEILYEDFFYQNLQDLLLTALSYQYLVPEDIENDTEATIYEDLQFYVGEIDTWEYEIKELPNSLIFSVYTDKKHQGFLKNLDYKWHSLARRWQKVIPSRELAKIEYKNLLQKIPKEDIETRYINDLSFLAYYYMGILNGYEYRKALLDLGYVWEGYGVDKMWVKRFEARNYRKELKKLTRLPGIEYKLVTPDLEKERRRELKKKKLLQKKKKQKRIQYFMD